MMKKLLLIIMIALLAVACGAEEAAVVGEISAETAAITASDSDMDSESEMDDTTATSDSNMDSEDDHAESDMDGESHEDDMDSEDDMDAAMAANDSDMDSEDDMDDAMAANDSDMDSEDDMDDTMAASDSDMDSEGDMDDTMAASDSDMDSEGDHAESDMDSESHEGDGDMSDEAYDEGYEDDDVMAEETDDMKAEMSEESADAMAAPAVVLPAWQTLPLVNAATGESFTLADFSGKTVFVEPMATWCTNCTQQLGNVLNAKAAVGGDDVVFVALSVETTLSSEKLHQYAQNNGFPFEFAVMSADMLQALVAEFGRSVGNPPSTPHFIIRPDGSFTGITTGKESGSEMAAQITSN